MRENTKENGNSDRAEGSSRQISKQSLRDKGKLAAGDQFGGDFFLQEPLLGFCSSSMSGLNTV